MAHRPGKRESSAAPSRSTKVWPPRAVPLLRRAKSPKVALPPQSVAVMLASGAKVLAEGLRPSEGRDAIVGFLAQLLVMLDEPSVAAALAAGRAAEVEAEQRPTPEGDPNN